MRRLKASALIVLVVGLFVSALLVWLLPDSGGDRPEPVQEPKLAEALSPGDGTAFARATSPRNFHFPADHGPHPRYRNEWWYLTGNVETDEGRHFGFQLTIFRIGLPLRHIPPSSLPKASSWRVDQIYMAHLALTDVAENRFYAFERFTRGALGLAGAHASPFHVWLEDWQIISLGTETFPIRLRAGSGDVRVELTLDSLKPVVLQGQQGLSRKSEEPGNASYYYSLTRLVTSGTIRIGTESHNVSGHAWLDREWSTSALSAEQTGWDWFALQLSNGYDFMFYRLRRTDGTVDPVSMGSLIDETGGAISLPLSAVTIRERRHWRSKTSGIRYPSAWLIVIPEKDIVLEVEPYQNNQELNVSVTYWEGAVRVRGRAGTANVTGHGYVELTGYGHERAP